MVIRKFIYIFFLTNNYLVLFSRSLHRPIDTAMPEIITRWVDEKKTYHLRSYHLEYQPLFTKFEKEYFFSHLLPKEEISFRNDKNQKVSGEILSDLIEDLLSQVYRHKTKFKNFKILKNKDFNIKTVSGLLILKFKDYPFVVKLFIETPQTFVNPFSKGWQPSIFFVMGGGINRYLSGFTRVKNLEAIKEKLKSNPALAQKIDTPRKWFWVPKDPKWFEICGKNIGPKDSCALLPSVYAIVADAINGAKNFSLLNKENRQFALEISNYLDNRLDPHIDNFMLEKETGKAVLVDTEHFPTMVGLTEHGKYKNYLNWYSTLSFKCFQDKFCRSKKYRRDLQKNPHKFLEL